MLYRICSLPGHGAGPYWSIAIKLWRWAIRFSKGGHDLSVDLDGRKRTLRVIHYPRIATHFSCLGMCFTVLYNSRAGI